MPNRNQSFHEITGRMATPVPSSDRRCLSRSSWRPFLTATEARGTASVRPSLSLGRENWPVISSDHLPADCQMQKADETFS